MLQYESTALNPVHLLPKLAEDRDSVLWILELVFLLDYSGAAKLQPLVQSFYIHVNIFVKIVRSSN